MRLYDRELARANNKLMALFGRNKEAMTSISKLYHHNLLGDITIIASYRNKNISITLRPSGEVRLTYPARSNSEQNALDFLDTKVKWIVATRQKLESKCKLMPDLADVDKLKHLEDLMARAKAYLPQRVEKIAADTGLKYRQLSLRAARTRWGSCSGKNNISLNIFLMELPQYLIDYVIIHELCHTVHHNHSPRFHYLVDKILAGEEKRLSQELKQYTIRR